MFSETASRIMSAVDPEGTFEIGPLKGRDARESCNCAVQNSRDFSTPLFGPRIGDFRGLTLRDAGLRGLALHASDPREGPQQSAAVPGSVRVGAMRRGRGGDGDPAGQGARLGHIDCPTHPFDPFNAGGRRLVWARFL